MAVEKFLFDTQFDAPPPPPEPEVVEEVVPEIPPEPPAPTFSEAELEDAKKRAWDDALAEGIRQGRAEILAAQGEVQNRLLESINNRIADVLTEQAARHTASRDMAMQIALAIARKILPNYTQRHGLAEVEAVVTQVMSEMGSEPRLVVRVADSQLDTITIKVQREAEQRGFAGKIVFMGDPEMGPADCRIEWAEGGVERDVRRLWSEIDRLTAQAMQPETIMTPQTTNQENKDV